MSRTRTIVVQAGHGVPGSPGYRLENQMINTIDQGYAGDYFYYDADLLNPATDYSVVAFLSQDQSDQLEPGDPWAQVNGPVAVSSAATTDLDLWLMANPPSSVLAFQGLAISTTQVFWSWNSAPSAGGYNLLNSGSGLVASVSGSATSYLSVTAGSNTYSAVTQVTAWNSFGASTVSVPAVASFAAVPGTPTFQGIFASSITLAWDAKGNSSPQTWYEVLRATTSGGPFLLFLSSGSSPATDPALLPNTSYYYSVRAVNLNGIRTVMSSTASVVTLGASGPSVTGTLTYNGRQTGLVIVQAAVSNSPFIPLYTARLPSAPSQAYNMSLAANTNYFLRGIVGNARAHRRSRAHVSNQQRPTGQHAPTMVHMVGNVGVQRPGR